MKIFINVSVLILILSSVACSDDEPTTRSNCSYSEGKSIFNELNNAGQEYDENPSEANCDALANAQKNMDNYFGRLDEDCVKNNWSESQVEDLLFWAYVEIAAAVIVVECQ